MRQNSAKVHLLLSRVLSYPVSLLLVNSCTKLCLGTLEGKIKKIMNNQFIPIGYPIYKMERLLKSISASSFPVKSLESPTYIAELKKATDEIKRREEGESEALRPYSEPAPIEITVINDLAKLR